jgi:glycine cleavage system regulatory protein
MDFPPVKPSLTVEERLDEIEDLLEAMCEDLTIQHMLEVRMMRNKAKKAKKDDSVVYDVKANYQ